MAIPEEKDERRREVIEEGGKAESLVKSIFSVPLRHLVLNLIALHGEMHGYEIMKKIKELTLNMWKPSTSTLYMVLDTLVNEGLLEKRIEYKGKMKRIKYKITEKGLEILALSTDISLKIMYRIVQRLEQVNQLVKEKKTPIRKLTPEDIQKQIDILEKIKEYIDLRIEYLKKQYKQLIDKNH